jgi:hypothetical protein
LLAEVDARKPSPLMVYSRVDGMISQLQGEIPLTGSLSAIKRHIIKVIIKPPTIAPIIKAEIAEIIFKPSQHYFQGESV